MRERRGCKAVASWVVGAICSVWLLVLGTLPASLQLGRRRGAQPQTQGPHALHFLWWPRAPYGAGCCSFTGWPTGAARNLKFLVLLVSPMLRQALAAFGERWRALAGVGRRWRAGVGGQVRTLHVGWEF